MPIMEWNDGFLLGIQEVDGHHEHLVALLNSTFDEYKEKVSLENLKIILDEMIDYAFYHFVCEERLMAESAYHGLAAHKAEHQVFTQRVIEIQKNFAQGINVSLEILTFLKDWVIEHILTTDAKYGKFLAALP